MSHLLAPLPYPWMPGKDYLASDMHAYGEVCIKQALEAAAKVIEQQPLDAGCNYARFTRKDLEHLADD